jgi:hypothetical protein
MSINSHLEELKRKHTTLSHAVEMAQRSPASDDMEVVGMKKKKLQLKEQISRLKKTRCKRPDHFHGPALDFVIVSS